MELKTRLNLFIRFCHFVGQLSMLENRFSHHTFSIILLPGKLKHLAKVSTLSPMNIFACIGFDNCSLYNYKIPYLASINIRPWYELKELRQSEICIRKCKYETDKGVFLAS